MSLDNADTRDETIKKLQKDAKHTEKPPLAPIPPSTSEGILKSSLLLTALSNLDTSSKKVPDASIPFLKNLPFFSHVQSQITAKDFTTMISNSTPTKSSTEGAPSGLSSLQPMAQSSQVAPPSSLASSSSSASSRSALKK
jgi:hypothetical protein